MTELRRITLESEIHQEDDSNWPEPNSLSRLELEIVQAGYHIFFVTTGIMSIAEIDNSEDPEGYWTLYWLAEDIKEFVSSVLALHFKVKLDLRAYLRG